MGDAFMHESVKGGSPQPQRKSSRGVAWQDDDASQQGGKSESFSQPALRRQQSASAFRVAASQKVTQSQATVQGLLSFSHGSHYNDPDSFIKDKESFKHEVNIVRRRVKTISRWTINPHAKFMQVWDAVTMGALLFTASVTPFEVAFFEADIHNGAFNFFFNRCESPPISTYVHIPIHHLRS